MRTIKKLSLAVFALYGVFFGYLSASIAAGIAPKEITSSALTFALSLVLCLLCAISSYIILTEKK